MMRTRFICVFFHGMLFTAIVVPHPGTMAQIEANTAVITAGALPDEIADPMLSLEAKTEARPSGLSQTIAAMSLYQLLQAGEQYHALKMIAAPETRAQWEPQAQDALLYAAAHGLPEVITALASKEVDLNVRDSFGNTAMHLAAKADDVYTLSWLAELGASLNEVNHDHCTPLIEAARQGSLKCAEALMLKGEDPLLSYHPNTHYPAYLAAVQNQHFDVAAMFRAHKFDGGPMINAACGDLEAFKEYVRDDKRNLLIDSTRTVTSPLMMAVANNHPELVSFLLDNGVSPISGTMDQQTLATVALLKGFSHIYDIFLEHGLSIEHRDSSFDGNTALIHMARAGKLDMINFLLDRGAGVGVTSKRADTPLHHAVFSKQLESARLLLDRGAVIDAKNGPAKTALHCAAENNQRDMAELLLSYGADINATDRKRWTPLHWAVENKHQGMATFLLGQSAEVNPRDREGNTPLHLAARSGQHNMLDLLLKKGANINEQNQSGAVPLHLACEKGYVDVVKTLLDHNADVNIPDANGQMPVFFALQQDFYEIARMVAAKNARLDMIDAHGASLVFPAARSNSADALRWLKEVGLPMNIVADGQLTPLHTAARYGSEGGVAFLLDEGLDINAPDAENMTPLHLASGRGHIMIVRLLVERGANIHVQDNQGRYPLHTATANGHWGPAQLFILRGQDVNVKDNDANTALHLAAAGGFQRTVKLLLTRGADFTARNQSGQRVLDIVREARQTLEKAEGLTPMQVSTRIGQWNTIQFLEAVIIDEYNNAARLKDNTFMKTLIATYPEYINAVFFGKTPLFTAVMNNNASTVETLLKAGADPNLTATTKNNWTPLHAAAHLGQEPIIRMLVDAGASLHALSSSDATPRDLAQKQNRPEIVALLESLATETAPTS